MSKIIYQCEVCGKRFDTLEEAEACEKAHAEEKARLAKLKAEKTERLNKIKADYASLIKEIELYNNDYNEPAAIPYTGALKNLINSLFMF